MMTRAEVLRKCLIVFDALRRVSSKGNAGLEAVPGAEESFRADAEICRVLREWLREMEAGENAIRMRKLTSEEFEELERKIRDGEETGTLLVPWGPTEKRLENLGDMLKRNPLMTQETIAAARRVDEARDKIIDQIGRQEPNVPKVVDLREWQRLAAEKPPERLDFDE